MGREKFIVLDVEGATGKPPYNIGYIVADRYGKIYKKRSFAFPEYIWENIAETLRIGVAVDMCKKNIQEILTDYGNRRTKRKYKLITSKEFVNFFNKDIKRYKVKRVFAYNVTFDRAAISRIYGEKFTDLTVDWCDIISGILTARLLTKSYIKYCIDNNYLTAKGNPQYKAEIVYRYLTKDSDFVEEHTGLADVLIEYDILLYAFKSHKALDFSVCSAWRKLANLKKELGL